MLLYQITTHMHKQHILDRMPLEAEFYLQESFLSPHTLTLLLQMESYKFLHWTLHDERRVLKVVSYVME